MRFRSDFSYVGLVCGAIFIFALFAGCTVEANWFPSGKAEIVDTRVEDLYGPVVYITYRLENTGESAIISTSTVSFRIETDVRSYYETICDSSRIYMQHQIYGIFEFALPDSEEQFVKATILDSFFE